MRMRDASQILTHIGALNNTKVETSVTFCRFLKSAPDIFSHDYFRTYTRPWLGQASKKSNTSIGLRRSIISIKKFETREIIKTGSNV